MPRLSFLALAACVLTATPAFAKLPSPADSELPCGINLVGSTGGAADPRGQFTIIVRDLAHNPVIGCDVRIDLTACGPDIRVCAAQLSAGVVVDCANSVVRATSDMQGQVTLRLIGSADNAPGLAAAGYETAKIYGDGVMLATVNIGAFDEDGAGGAGPADIALWLDDAFRAPESYAGRSDYDCSHSITPADLARLLDASLGGGSLESCASYCH